MTLPAIILAGGKARRMGGGDKSLLDLDGRPILAHVIDRLASQANPIVLNANGPKGRFDEFDLLVLEDSVPDWPGPLAGVLAGLDWAAQNGANAIVTVAADTPFFPRDLVDRLRSESDGIAPVLAASGALGETANRHPTFGLWTTTLRDDLRHALADGVRKIVAWADRHNARTARFDAPADLDPFFNVNTPADLEIARQRLADAA
ncbi:MAG: molybdenum cofactor guanylyltransferase MobA [Pseudomonadota bacterium]